MKSPNQTSISNYLVVNNLMTTAPNLMEETLRLKQSLKKQNNKDLLQVSNKENPTNEVLTVPQFFKMITEPNNDFCKEPSPSKLGISRSQDSDSNVEISEQKFGSVSPILSCTNRCNISPLGAAKAQNFRLKFRKSHTCGSLYANCNCSSPTSESIPIHAQHTHNQQTSAEHEHEHAAPTFQLSVSPTNTEASLISSKLTSSGIYSLSTQTSNATSMQLSRDESISTSFDHTQDILLANSQSATKQAIGSVHTDTERTNKKLQIPRRISNSKSTDAATTVARNERKQKRFFSSYSHPDTDFIFTDENKTPSRETLVQIHAQTDGTVIKSRGGRVEIKQPKRSSSPNIGQFQTLDVAVHPDILVKISPKHSPISDVRKALNTPSPLSARSAQQRRRLLQRSHEIESGGSTSDSEYNFEEATAKTTKTTKAPVADNSKPAAADTANFDAAKKYFAESGILGPIQTAASNNLIRKTSKILQDANVIEQIRRTSMIFRTNCSSPQNLCNLSSQNSSGNLKKSSISSCCQGNAQSMETSSSVIYSPSSIKSANTMATSCSFSPNITAQNCANNDDHDAQIKNLHGEVISLKDVIKAREAEIVKLRREIHKLKSVLQQTTNPLPIAKDDLLQSPPPRPLLSPLSPTTGGYSFNVPAALQSTDISSSNNNSCCSYCKRPFDTAFPNNNNSNTNATSSNDNTNATRLGSESTGSLSSSNSENYQSCNSSTKNNTTNTGATTVTWTLGGTNDKEATVERQELTLEAKANNELLSQNAMPKNKLLQNAQTPVLKKQGVSGESCETSMQQSINVPIPKYDKDYSAKQLIKDAIMDNDFLKNIDASQVRELVESMYPLSIAKGEFVIREGDVGAHLYVSAEGEFEVIKNGQVLGTMGSGKAFGELAILYNCTRTASIRVLSDSRLWVLDRRVFQQIMMRTGMQRIEDSVNFLKSVPLLKNLSDEVLAKIADVLEVEFYPAGTYIIRQGASGDTFFLISQGSVKVTQKLSPSAEEKEIRMLQRGDYFGEQALINEDKRTANIIAMLPGVECLTLDRDSFKHLIGDLCELKEKNYGDENRVLAMKYADKTKEIFGANVKQEFPNMKLTDLEVIATLGIGGFGRVELVKAYQENSVNIYALKCLKKRHIIDTKQEEHVFSERTIMLSCQTPFICRLYRTFRDDKYVYMLLEACMGGEIWTMLRDRGSFDDNAAQFIIGCVLEAFEYLHSRGIIYRDLKPENLMLDERGYVKLVDFGFAKYIGNSSKTWTFCGTPEYVAPEIILNKGHDRAVDYWALGILIHELLNGTPPFTANDPMKTYNIILKGIDMIDFPKHMSRSAVQLIKRLCRDIPIERLGYQKGGIQDIKKHKWFLGFDWDGLASQLLIPPFVRPIAHPTDTKYFDKFAYDPNEPPVENSGWDADF